MEMIIGKFSMDDICQNVNMERKELQIRNPNFRQPRQPTPQPPQILQKEKRNTNDQIRPPFHENQVHDNDFPQQYEEHINHVGDSEAKVFVTKEEHGRFASDSTSQTREDYDDYQKGYQNAMVEVQIQLVLRNR